MKAQRLELISRMKITNIFLHLKKNLTRLLYVKLRIHIAVGYRYEQGYQKANHY